MSILCRVVAREAGTAARRRSTRTANQRFTFGHRVTSPTPFGVQKQNWRVRRLARHDADSVFREAGTRRSRRSGRWVAGCVMVEARPTLYHERGVSPARATLRGARTARPRRWRPKSRRRKARRLSLAHSTDHSRGSSRQRCARVAGPPRSPRSRACGVPRRRGAAPSAPYLMSTTASRLGAPRSRRAPGASMLRD